MAQQTNRQYHLADDQLIVHLGLAKDNFTKHHSSFAEFNSVLFHPAYPSDLEASITAAKNTVSDAFIVKAQAKETADVKEISKVLEKSLRMLSFNVRAAFEDTPSILKEFRLTAISEFTINPDTFIGFGKDVLGVVNKYKVELLEVGMKEDLITTIQAQLRELDKQRREQMEAIQARPVLTKDRIDTMNNLWKHLVDLRDASDIVFDESPEIRALFALPKHTNRSSSEDVIVDIDEEIVVE